MRCVQIPKGNEQDGKSLFFEMKQNETEKQRPVAVFSLLTMFSFAYYLGGCCCQAIGESQIL